MTYRHNSTRSVNCSGFIIDHFVFDVHVNVRHGTQYLDDVLILLVAKVVQYRATILFL